MFRTGRLFALALAFPLAFACAQEGDEVGTTEDLTDEEIVGETDPLGGPDDMTDGDMAAGAEFDLDPVNDSGVTGSVVVERRDGGRVVRLWLENTQPSMEYIAHIHSGTCDNDLGVIVPLGDFTSSDTGLESETTLEGAQLLPGEEYFVQAHSADGTPVACAGLPDGAMVAENGTNGDGTTM